MVTKAIIPNDPLFGLPLVLRPKYFWTRFQQMFLVSPCWWLSGCDCACLLATKSRRLEIFCNSADSRQWARPSISETNNGRRMVSVSFCCLLSHCKVCTLCLSQNNFVCLSQNNFVFKWKTGAMSGSVQLGLSCHRLPTDGTVYACIVWARMHWLQINFLIIFAFLVRKIFSDKCRDGLRSYSFSQVF